MTQYHFELHGNPSCSSNGFQVFFLYTEKAHPAKLVHQLVSLQW